MTVKDYKENKHELLTIEELYLWAKEKGLEKSGMGLSIYDDDGLPIDDEEKDLAYCEEIRLDDIEIGGYFIDGKKIENCPMIWIYNHFMI